MVVAVLAVVAIMKATFIRVSVGIVRKGYIYSNLVRSFRHIDVHSPAVPICKYNPYKELKPERAKPRSPLVFHSVV